nr:MAG TPA: hypothetical protein [Caudoviricetes sp.]
MGRHARLRLYAEQWLTSLPIRAGFCIPRRPHNPQAGFA